MIIRAPIRASPVLLVIALLTGCSHDPQGVAVQPTEPPPTPLTAASSRSPSPVPSGTASASGSPAEVRPGYAFPVRSAAARFGRAHHDYPATDIFTSCGTEALAVTAGVVAEVSLKDDWTPRENSGATRGGLSVSIIGTDGVRYYGSHLASVLPGIVPGKPVRAGELLGRVGHTGSARSTACHLHFGISPPCAKRDWWTRRGVLSPYPFLISWRDRGRRSPAAAVNDWRARHGCPAKAPK